MSGSPPGPDAPGIAPPAEASDRPDVVVPSEPELAQAAPERRFGPPTRYQRRRRKYLPIVGRPHVPPGVAANPTASTERMAMAALGKWDDSTPNPWRRLWCRWYFRCLDFAATRGRQGWDQFTCRECDVRDTLTDGEKARMSDAFMRVFVAREGR